MSIDVQMSMVKFTNQPNAYCQSRFELATFNYFQWSFSTTTMLRESIEEHEHVATFGKMAVSRMTIITVYCLLVYIIAVLV